MPMEGYSGYTNTERNKKHWHLATGVVRNQAFQVHDELAHLAPQGDVPFQGMEVPLEAWFFKKKRFMK